ncbi:MAG: lipopolysaccharide biosynthesis protein [Piscinibacter sp.]|uniref:lipopolysaccharide biosynthesis protein n=1 Tax=Piscinibacter sp. TaxID=1903157 RepID=UPI003D0E7BEA
MSIERRALAGLKATALARLAGQALSWAATLVVFRLVDPQDYGLMAIVGTLVGIGAAVAEFGLGSALVQARELPQEQLARLAGVVWLLHGVMALALVAGAPLAAWFYGDPRLTAPLQAGAAVFVFAALGAVPSALATRELDFAWLARIEFASVIVGSALSLGLALLGAGVWALVAGLLGPAAVRCVLLIGWGQSVRPRLEFTGLRQHLSFSSQMAITQVIWSFVSQADVLIGGRLLSREALGHYSVAVHLATLPMHKVMGVVNQIAFAAVARLQDESERLRERVLFGTRLMMSLSVGVMWLLACIAPELLPLLIGPAWTDAVPVLQIVSLVVPLRMLMMMLATAISGIGAANVNLRNTLTAAVIWPVALYFGAQSGAVGLAAAWCVASPLTFALNARRVMSTLGMSLGDLLRLISRPLLAGTTMWAASAAVRALTTGLPSLLALALLAAVACVAYIASLLLLDRRLVADLRRVARAARD